MPFKWAKSGCKFSYAVDSIKGVIEGRKSYMVFIVGITDTQYAVFRVVRDYGIKMRVDISLVMVDGTGMCYACRVTVGGEVKFVCVDGPSFNACNVDFNELMKGNGFYFNKKIFYGTLDENVARDGYIIVENWSKGAQKRVPTLEYKDRGNSTKISES